MGFFDWVQFLRSKSNSRAKVSRKKNHSRSRPWLETLEQRILFAVLPVALVAMLGGVGLLVGISA